MIILIFLFLISILLEIMISNVFINILPIFSLSIVMFLSVKLESKIFYKILFFFGIISSLICSSSLFLYSICYLLIGLICKLIIKDFTIIKYVLIYIFLSYLYLLVIFLYTIFYNGINIVKLTSLYINSLPINIFYFLICFVIYYLFCNRIKK